MKALLFTSKERRPGALWIYAAPCLLNKVADDHGVSSGITGSVIK